MRGVDLLLIDGRHLFWRSASAVPLSADDSPTGGIYTFLRALVRVHDQFGGFPVVCWEGGKRRDLVRTEIYEDYKLRPPMDEARQEIVEQMYEQYDKLLDLLDTIGITQAKAPRWEADDAMATLAHRHERNGGLVGIFTGDSDMCQCISDKVCLIRPVKKGVKVIDSEGVYDWLGVPPKLVPFLKALSGDSSDNIPGVPGIGSVIGARLANELGGYKGLHEAVNSDSKPAVTRFGDKAWGALKEATKQGAVSKSYKLATVNREVKIKLSRSKYDQKELISKLMVLKFKSLIRSRELEALCRLAG